MNDFYLRKDEIEFMTRDLRKRGYSWDEIDYRKAKLQQQLVKLKKKLQKQDLSPTELNLRFKEEFAKLISR